MTETREQRIQARINQAERELEMAPRMLGYLETRLAIHKDNCQACLSRGYCVQHNRISSDAREWSRLAGWTQFSKIDFENEEDAANPN